MLVSFITVVGTTGLLNRIIIIICFKLISEAYITDD